MSSCTECHGKMGNNHTSLNCPLLAHPTNNAADDELRENIKVILRIYDADPFSVPPTMFDEEANEIIALITANRAQAVREALERVQAAMLKEVNLINSTTETVAIVTKDAIAAEKERANG